MQAVEARGASMGLEGLEQHAGSAHDNARVRTWLRKSLNEQALGARLLALSHDAILLEDWFERSAHNLILYEASFLVGLVIHHDICTLCNLL